MQFTPAERLMVMTLVAEEIAKDLRERNKLFMVYGPGDEWDRIKKQHGWDERRAKLVSINDKLYKTI